MLQELMVNSERLRTLIILRRDEKMYQDRLQKNRWLLVNSYSFTLHLSI